MNNIVDEKIIIKNNLTRNLLAETDVIFTLEESSITLSIDNEELFENFDREILWDFGDGTKIKGTSASHYYKQPGVYFINCTFFDRNNNAYINIHPRNDHVINVIDPIETYLSITEDYISKCEQGLLANVKAGELINCAELVSTIGVSIDKDVPIKLTSENNNTKHISELPKNEAFKHLLPYHSFYNSNFEPVAEIVPEYNDIYLSFNNINNLKLRFYIIDPNNDIDINDLKLSKISYDYEILKINNINDIDELIFTKIGKIGKVKVFFKDDLPSSGVVNLNYVLDQNYFPDKNIILSKNSINLVSLGVSFSVKPNKLSGDEIIFISTNGLCSKEISQLSEAELENINDVNENLYSFMTAKYVNIAAPFVIRMIANTDNPYFIKDIAFKNIKVDTLSDKSLIYKINSEYKTKNSEYLFASSGNIFGLIIPLKEVKGEDVGINITFNAVPVNGTENKNYSFKINNLTFINFDSFTNNTSEFYLNPKQKGVEFSFFEFWKAYQTHPTVQDKEKLTNYMTSIFNSDNFIKNIIDKGYNFVDDISNIKTCSIKNLISILDSLGENINIYNNENFSRPLIIETLLKIISIQHSKLIGTTIKKDDEFETIDKMPGKNLGSQIDIKNEKIYIKKDINGNYIWPKIVCLDKFSNKFFVVNTAQVEKAQSGSPIIHGEGDEDDYFFINDYFADWGWGLLLGEYEYKHSTILTPEKAPLITELLTKEDTFIKANYNPEYKDIIKVNYIDNISKFYNFYHYIDTPEIDTIDSYLEPDSISNNIKDYDTWTKKDGSIDRLLYKTLIENLGLN